MRASGELDRLIFGVAGAVQWKCSGVQGRAVIGEYNRAGRVEGAARGGAILNEGLAIGRVACAVQHVSAEDVRRAVGEICGIRAEDVACGEIEGDDTSEQSTVFPGDVYRYPGGIVAGGKGAIARVVSLDGVTAAGEEHIA